LALTTAQVKGTKAPAIYTNGGALVGQGASSAGTESRLTVCTVQVLGESQSLNGGNRFSRIKANVIVIEIRGWLLCMIGTAQAVLGNATVLELPA
jgi:hypothetical protein